MTGYYDFKETDSSDPSALEEKTLWLERLRAAKEANKGFLAECKDIYNIYTNGYNEGIAKEKGKSESDFNVPWMTYETSCEAIYGRTPVVVPVLRQGFDTPATKCAQLITKRNIDYILDDPDGIFDETMKDCRKDYMLCAFGQAWVYYLPENSSEMVISDEGEYVDEETGEEYSQESFLLKEAVEVRYLSYKDYRHDPVEKWHKVKWVAKREKLSPDEFKEAFGEEKSKSVKYTEVDDKAVLSEQVKQKESRKVEVWEIWDKKEKKVIYISEQYPGEVIDKIDPPIKFKNFFPCPKPLLGTIRNDSLVPVSDLGIMKETINSLDLCCKRIKGLREAIRVFGLYDASLPDLQNLFDTYGDLLQPVAQWSKYVENGKFAGAVDFVPLVEFTNALRELNDEKGRLEQDYYKLSGYNSIMQGEAVPNESVEARQSRSKFTDLRLSSRQKEMQRFARDCISLMAEVLFNKYEDDTILAIASISESDSPEFTEEVQRQAVEFLRDEIARTMAINLETDSTLAINGDAEKQDRLEFSNAAINAINAAIGVSESLPEFMDPVIQMTKFSLEPFAASQPVEISLDRSFKAYKERKEAEAQQPPQIPVEIQEMQMKQQIEQAKLQMEGQKNMQSANQAAQDAQMKFHIKQQELQFDYQKLQVDTNNAMMKFQNEMRLQYEKIQGDMMLMREKLMAEIQLKQQGQTVDAQLQNQNNIMQAQVKQQSNRQDAAVKQEKNIMDVQVKMQKNQLDRQTDLQKTAIETRANQEAALMKMQVDAQKAQTPDVNITPSQPTPITINNNLPKGTK